MLENRALLATIGHFHGVIAETPIAEPVAAEPVLEAQASVTAQAPLQPGASESRSAPGNPERIPPVEEFRSGLNLLESNPWMGNIETAQAANGNGLSNVALLAEHHGHAPQGSDAALPVHSGHGADIALPVAGVAAIALSHSHGASAAEVEVGAAIGQAKTDLQGAELDIAQSSHHSAESTDADELTRKFAPKRCTVRYTAKEVFRDAAGERKCDCLPAGAVETIARESEPAIEGAGVATIFANFDIASCVPCQRQLAAEAAVCTLADMINARNSSMELCEAKRADDGAWAQGVTSFYEGLQTVGWTLLGTGVLAVALKREHKPRAAAAVTNVLQLDAHRLPITGS